MSKTYKIGEVANILGVSADTIRYYEKMGIAYSHKDSHNGYRYFTISDVYALLDVLFYRNLEISVEEVRKIMQEYHHRDVKNLLIEREEQLSEKLYEQAQLLAKIRATIQDYQIMEESLGVFRVQPMPPMLVFNESPADSQAYFNTVMDRESQSPAQTQISPIEHGFFAGKGKEGWEITRLFTAIPAQMGEKVKNQNERIVHYPKAIYTVVRSPWGIPMREMMEPAFQYAKNNGLEVGSEVFGLWVFTEYNHESPMDYVSLYIPVA